MTEYQGSPWRSRFLRAPKLALALAGLPEFVPLEQLAELRLGLKTGADKFFFVRRAAAGRSGSEINVTGLGGAWRGLISARDLSPTALNPHELFAADGTRLFTIPKLTPSLYLSPRDREPVAGLREYVTAGEHLGVNRQKLVTSNASATRWYRQTRGVVTAEWALPYNSGYDYGAWENPFAAVLNGRFVGVSAREPGLRRALGAVLNSTFVMMTRLLEGTATGVEGAFDVGPPAARKMKVPDVRRFSEEGLTEVAEALETWRRDDVMPPGPDKDGRIDPRRNRLDLSILEAVGMSRGEASALTGRVYESYARWRRAIEAVETTMRSNRREMARNLSGRSVKPTELAAQRVWEELAPELALVPRDLLSGDEDIEFVSLPRKLGNRPSQPGLFPGVLLHPDGSETDLKSFERVRYADMLLSIGFEPPLVIPMSGVRAGAIAEAFVEQRRRLLASAAERASTYVSDTDAIQTVVKTVERHWLRGCRAAGMEPPELPN